MGADAKIDLEKVSTSEYISHENIHPECDRNSSLTTPSIPVGHRKDVWAGFPYPSIGCGNVAASPSCTTESITAGRGSTMVV